VNTRLTGHVIKKKRGGGRVNFKPHFQPKPRLPAWAATEVDANGDGVMTLDEMQALFPDVTEEAITTEDTDADGALSDGEMVAAQEAGVIPSES